MAKVSPVAVSVVIRSYNRLDACIELINVILKQDFEDFEIVVIEQSTNVSDGQQAELENLQTTNDRLRILKYPPLGPARARNEGWKMARGEVVVFCDDDDIPMDTAWLSAHMKNYSDPDIIGVSGREVMDPNETCGYSNRKRARRMCLSYDFFGYPNVYCRLDERVDKVDWLHGGNASVRRSFIERVGGWQGNMVDHEEHSFAFRLVKILRGKQRLIFDPTPVVLRRKDIPGGLDRRAQTPFEFFFLWFIYVHRIVARYRPFRVILLYAVYYFWLQGISIHKLWKLPERRQRSLTGKLALNIWILLIFPVWFMLGWITFLKKR